MDSLHENVPFSLFASVRAIVLLHDERIAEAREAYDREVDEAGKRLHRAGKDALAEAENALTRLGLGDYTLTPTAKDEQIEIVDLPDYTRCGSLPRPFTNLEETSERDFSRNERDRETPPAGSEGTDDAGADVDRLPDELSDGPTGDTDSADIAASGESPDNGSGEDKAGPASDAQGNGTFPGPGTTDSGVGGSDRKETQKEKAVAAEWTCPACQYSGPYRTSRICKTCHNAYQANWQRKRKAANRTAIEVKNGVLPPIKTASPRLGSGPTTCSVENGFPKIGQRSAPASSRKAAVPAESMSLDFAAQRGEIEAGKKQFPKGFDLRRETGTKAGEAVYFAAAIGTPRAPGTAAVCRWLPKASGIWEERRLNAEGREID